MRFINTLALVTLALAVPLHAADAKPADDGKPLYTVVDGNKVDPDTLKGFRAWRAAACHRRHGANQGLSTIHI